MYSEITALDDIKRHPINDGHGRDSFELSTSHPVLASRDCNLIKVKVHGPPSKVDGPTMAPRNDSLKGSQKE